MGNKKWYFPYGYDIEKESVNNARIETFRDNILESLARETCQNSLDAAINDDAPVVMIFEELEMDIGELIDRDSFINEIIPKSKKTWKEDSKSQEFLDGYEEMLLREKIKVLRIGDYNTTGLKEANWQSLIENAGMSVKGDIGSGGSFGIGKSAPFASSDLRMVFYNTRTVAGEEKAIGVTKFISFDNHDGSTAQGVGYLGAENKDPLEEQFTFGFEERPMPGTDLFIIGFNQGDSWREDIIESLLENFLVSIYRNMLYIKVDNTIIEKDTMGELIKNYNGKKYDELKNYYSVLEKLEEGEAKKIVLDESFEKYGFKPEDGTLIISRGENANRSVLMTRKAGMKIIDRKGISGSIQFNGIFQATGDEFNRILKEMENPSHNDWIASRYSDPKLGKELLLTIFRFIKNNVIENFRKKIEKQVDAFGMSDFLPNKIQDRQNNEAEIESLDSKIEKIELKGKRLNQKTTNEQENADIEKQLERMGLVDDGVTTKEESGKKDVNEEEGTYMVERSDEGELKSYKISSKVSYRIIENDYINGTYTVNIESNKNIDDLKVEILLVGENGSSYSVDISNVFLKDLKLEEKENSFIINKILKDNLYRIKFNIPYSQRMKMEVRFYEYK